MRFTPWTALFGITLLTGCSQEFPQEPWSKSDMEYLQSLDGEQDFDSRLEIARQNFTHNYIDEANALLSELVTENPDDMEAKAWYAANNCKIAGRKGPWLMGLDKLYGVWACLTDIQRASETAPDNFTVQLIQINTYAEVDMFGSRDKATGSLEKLLAKIEKQSDLYAPSAQVAAYETAVRLEALKSTDPQQSRIYLKKIIQLNADPQSVDRANKTLAKLSKK